MTPTTSLKRVFTLAANKRVRLALGVDALFSVSNLLLTVAIARQASIADFGAFGVAMVLYLLCIGVIRSAVTDTTLSLGPSQENLHRGFQRALTISLGAAISLVVAGTVASASFLWILGVCLPGLVALDYIRVTNSAMYRPLLSLLLGVSWTACVLAISGAALFWPISPTIVFAIWAASGSILGIVSWAATRLPWLPKWHRNRSETRAAVWFSIDYLAGSGGSLLSTSLLGTTLGTSLVGALRGAGTLLGPANLVSATARSLTLPYLTRARAGGNMNEWRAAISATGLLLLVASPLAALVVLLPSSIGVQLLGETWWIAAPVMLPLAIESVLALAGSIASAGHRARLAGARAVTLRLSVGAIRPAVIVAAGASQGAVGAAWAMSAISLANLILWWVSYRQLTHRKEPTEADEARRVTPQ